MDALALRRVIAARRPRFRHHEWFRYRNLEDHGWRRPVGIQSKIRCGKRGKPNLVEPGYRSPKAARGLHPSGLVEVLVHNADELDRLDPSSQAARISATVGRRKRPLVVKKADDLGIRVLNRGSPAAAKEGGPAAKGPEE